MMKVKRLHRDAILPSRAHDTDAGLDVYSIDKVYIPHGKDAVIKTGFSMSLPDGWVAIVKEKSGRAVKNKLTIGACVIDSGYRGEVLIHLFNNGLVPNDDVIIQAGEAIAQLVVVPCWCGQPEEVVTLETTERGEGKFGSTGLRSVEPNYEWEGNEFDGYTKTPKRPPYQPRKWTDEVE